MKLLMFPGQGSQYPGMAKDWFESFPVARLAFEEASDGSGLSLKKIIFEGDETELKQTEFTQPAILTATIAIFRALEENTALRDLAANKDALFAGHSLGEYSALVAAGALPLGVAAGLVRRRGQLMQAAVPAGQGGMAALVFKPRSNGTPLARELCAEAAKRSGRVIELANINSPEQIVVAGHMAALAVAEELSADARFGVRKYVALPVSAPFHSSLMKPAADGLRPDLEAAAWQARPEKRYVANVDARIHSLGDSDGVVERLCSQIHGSVRWVESVESALAMGLVEALEIGPGKVLSGLVKRVNWEGRVLAAKGIDSLEEFRNDGERL